MNPETNVALDTLWVLLTASLVMNAGFAMFEASTDVCGGSDVLGLSGWILVGMVTKVAQE